MAEVEIFDRVVRRIRRDRAQPLFAAHGFLRDHIVDELLERLDMVTRRFTRVLDLGCADGAAGAALKARGIAVVSADPGFAFAHAAGGVQCDEDRLPFADGSFDLVLAAGTLDTVNDLPGALALIRRVLRPDGLFLGGFVGGDSLLRMRQALMAADMAHGPVAARTHPRIDVRAAGDLLRRAGFALPVADTLPLTVRYADPLRLIADLRGMAGTNLLKDRTPLPRIGLSALFDALMPDADGRFGEHFDLVILTGWSPSPDQPQPARRGSGTRSLGDVLGKR